MSKIIRKQLIAAILSTILAATVFVSATFAWFSANSIVTATSMQVNAATSTALVISKELSVGTLTSVSFETGTNELTPATHDSTVTIDNTLSGVATGLKYNTNPSAVSAGTGYAAGETALTFDTAINDSPTGNYYYLDYTVYVASAGSVMENTGLSAYAFTGVEITADTTKATSIDFYVSEDSANLGAYKGTLNLSNLTAAANSDGITYYTTNIQLLPNTSTIPQNNSTSDYLKITMRVYYDGALEKSAGQAYIYSDVVTTTGTAFNVNFKATTA